MALHKTYTNKTGFTLLEVIIVIGLFLVVSALSLHIDVRTIRTQTYRDDVNALETALRTARTRALTAYCVGICTGPQAHGIYFAYDHYIIFQGNSYNPTNPYNVSVPLDSGLRVHGLYTVTFLPRSGMATTTPHTVWDLDLIQPGGVASAIHFNSEGRIYE